VSQRFVLFVTGKTIGQGEEKLGEKLLTAFFQVLEEGEDLPAHILLMHEGVKLSVEETPVLDVLKVLERKGVKIFSCGTCLDYYNIKDQLKVGQVGNMYGIKDILVKADKIINLG
jgi:selenium metabolism protein YedF